VPIHGHGLGCLVENREMEEAEGVEGNGLMGHRHGRGEVASAGTGMRGSAGCPCAVRLAR
jgi:hypothetical protein